MQSNTAFCQFGRLEENSLFNRLFFWTNEDRFAALYPLRTDVVLIFKFVSLSKLVLQTS